MSWEIILGNNLCHSRCNRASYLQVARQRRLGTSTEKGV